MISTSAQKTFYLSGRILATALALVVSGWQLKKMVIGWMAAGPAVELLSIAVVPGRPSETQKVLVQFSKLRPCEIKSAVLSIDDAAGISHAADVNWEASFPVKKFISTALLWDVPATARPGRVKAAAFEIRHWRCADGPDPQEPVSYAMEAFEVLP